MDVFLEQVMAGFVCMLCLLCRLLSVFGHTFLNLRISHRIWKRK